MWRRISSQLQKTLTLASSKSRSLISSRRFVSSPETPFRPSASLFSRRFSSDSGTVVTEGKKKIEDVAPIATGHEREELEAELEGRNILDIDYPVGPFGTKEEPAIVKSVYDRRIVGCPGGEDEDEHDVVWFWLEKGKPHECPVCSQYFMLEVVGQGGPPPGHEEEGDHHHHH